MSEEIGESRFCMWRAVVAMAHADGVVTPHELSFINDYLKDINLSTQQKKIIGEDLGTAQDVCDLFSQIKEQQDKADFFALARALSWCDGDYDAQEQFIIEHLEQLDLEEDDKDVLRQSRDVFNEIELSTDQWAVQTVRNKKIFSFLGGVKS